MSIFLEMMAEVGFVISVLEIPEVILKAVLEVYPSLAYVFHITNRAD